ncbi:diguanylate cyclase domain-containing protein [Halomonas sp. TD01]|uniref:diguanylate cyclase domain-containing protein n=1 Tax=Halomonas sp. TD01 TaxID=999141 RepID=UPI000214F45D|nr:diguanylate cyclase [Halomonas sp. TD01]EGP21490.1 response regulator receiver modulated diguanylate cyclase/phosphodiesterase with PAS/PAC sensor(s) [Halomonas sp. TD01]
MDKNVMLYGGHQSNNAQTTENDAEQVADERLRSVENALQVERGWAKATLNSIGDAVLTTDLSARVTYLNRVAEALTGWASVEALGKSIDQVLKLINIRTNEPAPNPALRAIEENRTVGLALDCVLIRQDGSQLEIEDSAAPIHDSHGVTVGAVIVFHDAKHSLTRAEQLAYQAHYDALTKLPNRFLFAEHLARAIRLAKRHDHYVALLYLDIDNFKCINDSLGHAVGDSLLQFVATCLVECVRDTDCVCRQGGDEFIVLLSEIEKLTDAARVAEKILRALAMPCNVGHYELGISVSIGISFYPDHGLNEYSLLENADTAMYRAKKSGRNQCQVFSHDMNNKN